MAPEVVFYRLNRKVVHNREAIPEDARQVMYYSLMIGHHVGVMDCFSELMAIPVEQYGQVLTAMAEGEARRKLGGALEWNEIEISRAHVDLLLPALQGMLQRAGDENREWISTFTRCLREMVEEPALYLMVKVRP